MADDFFTLKPQPQAPELAFRRARTAAPAALKTRPQETSEAERLKQACESFEALFTQQMLKQMRATVPQDGMFGGGSAERIYTDMLDAELSKEMAAERGLGIARLLFEHMMAAKNMRAETKD
jgi:flagellar protein FlgJ